jgi:hypothetical protein
MMTTIERWIYHENTTGQAEASLTEEPHPVVVMLTIVPYSDHECDGENKLKELMKFAD